MYNFFLIRQPRTSSHYTNVENKQAQNNNVFLNHTKYHSKWGLTHDTWRSRKRWDNRLKNYGPCITTIFYAILPGEKHKQSPRGHHTHCVNADNVIM